MTWKNPGVIAEIVAAAAVVVVPGTSAAGTSELSRYVFREVRDEE